MEDTVTMRYNCSLYKALISFERKKNAYTKLLENLIKQYTNKFKIIR